MRNLLCFLLTGRHAIDSAPGGQPEQNNRRLVQQVATPVPIPMEPIAFDAKNAAACLNCSVRQTRTLILNSELIPV
jgi:hypothetical protein